MAGALRDRRPQLELLAAFLGAAGAIANHEDKGKASTWRGSAFEILHYLDRNSNPFRRLNPAGVEPGQLASLFWGKVAGTFLEHSLEKDGCFWKGDKKKWHFLIVCDELNSFLLQSLWRKIIRIPIIIWNVTELTYNANIYSVEEF